MNADKPMPTVQLERAKELSDYRMHSIALQERRFVFHEQEDGDFALRPIADFEFFIIALMGLRSAIASVRHLVDVNAALATFDAQLPKLRWWRNVLAHPEDFAGGKGHNKEIDRRSLFTMKFNGNYRQGALVLEPRDAKAEDELGGIEWMGERLDVEVAKRAGYNLYREFLVKIKAVQGSRSPSSQGFPGGGA